MTHILVHDLRTSRNLDRAALTSARGGRMAFGWILPYQRKTTTSPFNVFIGQLQVLINPIFNQITQTVNQVEFVNIDASDVVDSSLTISVDQGQSGAVGSLPSVL